MDVAPIPIWQYLRPNGERRLCHIERDAEVTQKATAIRRQGYRFEAEILVTGEVSLTIVGYDPATEEEGDVAIAVAPNDKRVLEAFDDMVNTFKLTHEQGGD